MDQKQKEQAYFQAQIECIQALAKIGIHYKIEDRIPPMKIMRHLRSVQLLHGEVQECLAKLIFLRSQGYEPKLKEVTGTY